MKHPLEIVKSIRADIEYLSKSASNHDKHKTTVNYFGNIAKYAITLGYSSRLTWDIESISNRYLTKLEQLTDPTHENLDAAVRLYNNYQTDTADLIKNHWNTSNHARGLNSTWEYLFLWGGDIKDSDAYHRDTMRVRFGKELLFRAAQKDKESLINSLPTDVINRIQRLGV